MLSRRTWLTHVGAAATAHAVLPHMLAAAATRNGTFRIPGYESSDAPIDTSTVQRLAQYAMDAISSKHVEYADIRLIRSRGYDTVGAGHVVRGVHDSISVGVRCRINGYWGFAASNIWTTDEMSRLAKSAVEQARIMSEVFGSPRAITWPSIPPARGEWTTPGIDPFSIPLEEKYDMQYALDQYLMDSGYDGAFGWGCGRDELTFASTEGALFTQTTYMVFGNYGIGNGRFGASSRPMGRYGRGWDHFFEANLYEQLPQVAERARSLQGLKQTTMDIGRYDVVFDAATVAALLHATIGTATQLGRAVGNQANGSGTSYLGPDPLDFLGQEPIASPLITVTADRSMVGGLATVKWDHEGVEPEEATLVQNGVLVDYQTIREQAGWLAPWYTKRNIPIRSHGYAGMDRELKANALRPTTLGRPNLVLAPGKDDLTMNDLIANVKRGLAVFGNAVTVDWQAKHGRGGTFNQGPSEVQMVREIVNGKLGRIVEGLEWSFNSSELWKSATAIGGPRSKEMFGAGTCSLQTVPVTFRNVTMLRGG
jgi:TldD protein